MEDGRVTAVVINYNNGRYIEKCIRSLAEQTYPDMEVVVVDDGSSDESRTVISELQKEYPCVHLFAQYNHGISYTRNIGVALVHTEYFMFVDSDDWCEKNMVARMMEEMKKDADCDMVECGFTMDYPLGKLYRLAPHNRSYSRMEALHALLGNTRVNNYPWGKLYRTETFRDVLFPLSCEGYEDIATIYRCMENCRRIRTISDRLYHYVQHSGSYTGVPSMKKNEAMVHQFEMQAAALQARYPDEPFDTTENMYRSAMFILFTAILYSQRKEIPATCRLPYFHFTRIPLIFLLAYVLLEILLFIRHGIWLHRKAPGPQSSMEEIGEYM